MSSVSHAQPPRFDFDDVKAAVDCRVVAEAWGVRPAKTKSPGPNQKFHCFNGGAHSNGDRRPDLSICADSFHCFGCGVTGSALDLVAFVDDVDLAEASRRLGQWAGLDPTAREAWSRARGRRRPPPPPRPIVRVDASDAERPPVEEVLGVWSSCVPVDLDEAVAAFLVGRGVDPARVADFDLARALPANCSLPPWARLGGFSWRDGWRLLFPCYDASGALVTLRARWVAGSPSEGLASPKEISSSGYKSYGTVYACQLGRVLLASHNAELVQVAGVDIAEGGMDWLTLASSHSDAAVDAPATLGIWSGAWTQELARRIPDQTTVTIWTDPDDSGDRYAKQINAAFGVRCDIRRAQLQRYSE